MLKEEARGMARKRIKPPILNDKVYTGTRRADGVVRKDVMSPATRSALMGRIRGKGTGPERLLLGLFEAAGLRPELHVAALPGSPDFVFSSEKVVVFVDGDFWHGWRFPAWEQKLMPRWRDKIAATRARDRRNHARLRRAGWIVVRIWEHQLKTDPEDCLGRVARALNRSLNFISAA
jgi:DNA mismatch endonuclease (patch repair protein)